MEPSQAGDPPFRRDLYAGTAPDYEQHRLPYPAGLARELARQAGTSGTGRLLDLACGTGQLTFALRPYVAEIWAVDQEPDMTAMVTRKAGLDGGIRVVTAAAEELAAPAGSFGLVTIGNAFQRLPREAVASRVLRWLRPGGLLALVWGGSPDEPGPGGLTAWQQALVAVVSRWRADAGRGRLPDGWASARRNRPDSVILTGAGFAAGGRREFAAIRQWTADDLAGYQFSTSVLSRAALGGRAADLTADLRRELQVRAGPGPYRQDLTFACDLFRRPG
ncbi:MAG TPA: class I SAM-dependent methyltransferase [Streptosporangiaceae bacterium]|jgi:SAM-dependent methyltransferase